MKKREFLPYLYHLANQKRDTNLLTVYEMASKFIKYDRLNQLERVCKATDMVAIHALKMTDKQRRINRSRCVNVGGRTYYLFDKRAAWSVGVITQPDVYIYQ